MKGIRKDYPGVVALDGVYLDVRAGEIHCLLGENGAGKSTLMSILAGAVRSDAGTIELGGREVELRSPSDAFRLGIGMIHQDPALVPGLSVAENILLGHEPGAWLIDRKEMRRRASELLGKLGVEQAGGARAAATPTGAGGPTRPAADAIDPDNPADRLTPGHRQITAIARALSRDLRLLILDEPSVSLTSHELQNLEIMLRRLRDAGTGIIYITHRLEEIFSLGDRITVLRDGRRIECLDVADATRPGLIKLMAGREMSESSGREGRGSQREVRGPGPELQQTPLAVSRAFPDLPTIGDPSEHSGGEPWTAEQGTGTELLRVEGLGGGLLSDISFTLAKGEVLGVAGLAGSGRTTLARLIFGATRRTGGRMYLEGLEHTPRTPVDGIAAGVGYLPGDRNHDGLIPELSVRDNMMLAGGKHARRGGRAGLQWAIDRSAETALCRSYMESLEIDAPSTETEVRVLSGGNKQKVILARWLMTNSRLLIFHEPTAGIDVGVKFELHATIGRLAAEGRGIIVLSSDLPELFAVADRIIVLNGGRMAGIVDAASSTQEQVVALATGAAEAGS